MGVLSQHSDETSNVLAKVCKLTPMFLNNPRENIFGNGHIALVTPGCACICEASQKSAQYFTQSMNRASQFIRLGIAFHMSKPFLQEQHGFVQSTREVRY